MEALQANLDARLSVAGSALSAIQQMNDNERNAFIDSCNHRRRQLLGMIAWDFRQVWCACVADKSFFVNIPGSTSLALRSCSYCAFNNRFLPKFKYQALRVRLWMLLPLIFSLESALFCILPSFFDHVSVKLHIWQCSNRKWNVFLTKKENHNPLHHPLLRCLICLLLLSP